MVYLYLVLELDGCVPFLIFLFCRTSENLKFKTGKEWLRFGLVSLFFFHSASVFENS